MEKQNCTVYFNQETICFVAERSNIPFVSRRVVSVLYRDSRPSELEKALFQSLDEFVEDTQMSSEKSGENWKSFFKELKDIFKISSEKDLYLSIRNFGLTREGRVLRITRWANTSQGYSIVPQLP